MRNVFHRLGQFLLGHQLVALFGLEGVVLGKEVQGRL